MNKKTAIPATIIKRAITRSDLSEILLISLIVRVLVFISFSLKMAAAF
jgi:hypothetical protein